MTLLSTLRQWLKKEPVRLLVLVLLLFFVRFYFLFFFYEGFTGGGFAAFLRNKLLFTSLPFEQGSVCLGALLYPVFFATLVLFYFYVFKTKTSFGFGSEYTSAIRLLVFVPAALLTWELVTYDYNYYLDSAFLPDRFLLILLTVLIWRFPIVVPLYLCFVLVYRAQFNYPIGGFMLIDKRILIEILLLFTAWKLLSKYVAVPARHFLLVVFCLTAVNYVSSGMSKILISPHGYEWVQYNDLNHFFFNAHSRGWMEHLSPEKTVSIARFFDRWGVFLQWYTLVTELSMFFILWRKNTAIVLLAFSVLLHLGIFLAGSMLFWKWMVVDLLLISILLFWKPLSAQIFSPLSFRYSLLVMVVLWILLRPSHIGWHDTPLNQFFTFEATDAAGNTCVLSRNDFEPYHQLFQLDQFTYLVNQKTLDLTGFGYTPRYPLAQAIEQAGPKGIRQLEEQLGHNHYNRSQRNAFVQFIRQFFHHRNHMAGQHPWLYYLHAPHHLYSTARNIKCRTQAPPIRITVYFEQTWRQGTQLLNLERKTCEVIEIPQ